MNNENNGSNQELDQNPPLENISPQQHEVSDQLLSETETITSITEESTVIPPSTEKKKRNPYKIAFFALGGVVILGTASFFGSKYLKKTEVPVVENSCLNTDTKIYDAYKDAVALVKHQYGYFVRIKGKEFQLTVPEATEQTVYGTGFFIDRKGNLLTNSHVLQPWNSSDGESEKVNTNIRNFRMKIASILTIDVSEDGYETFILGNWGNASVNYDDGEHEYNEGEESVSSGEEFISSNDVRVDSAAESGDIAASIPHQQYVSENEIEVYVKTIDISIALHDSDGEWLSCTFGKISDDPQVDLGALQLTTQETPKNITNIINLDNLIEDDKTLKPGQKAIMVGYPLGIDLAQTNSGIKVQLYNGQISKESDGNKVQYNITSTHGASGAPVFNECGQLIAVNFSGVDQVQGFNFGIVAKHVKILFGKYSAPAV
ncbi:S1 family peptidase [Chryseobacterium gwangjuense]|uniref:S1 family peptidase n=1 Tax=Chryseobacterium gwangjuense TaxID=1069980 RepID=UPI001E2B8D23|nr:serine protease [Chryseobacterium gwangjuense]MCE3074532.1 serine protease [Chryseobacterium gwangjuense]